jgi:hypothetical protein
MLASCWWDSLYERWAKLQEANERRSEKAQLAWQRKTKKQHAQEMTEEARSGLEFLESLLEAFGGRRFSAIQYVPLV